MYQTPGEATRGVAELGRKLLDTLPGGRADPGISFIARVTVWRETPAAAATSRIVARGVRGSREREAMPVSLGGSGGGRVSLRPGRRQASSGPFMGPIAGGGLVVKAE